MQTIHSSITDMTFISNMESVLRLLQPILAALQSLEADRPLLSQCLPLWLSAVKHVHAWAASELQPVLEMQAVLLKRFAKCYHKGMAAAYLADPVFYVPDPDGQSYVVNSRALAEFQQHLKVDVWKDATEVSLASHAATSAAHTCMITADLQLNVVLQLVHRMVGRSFSGKATIELTMLQVNGLPNEDLGAALVAIEPCDTLGRSRFVEPMQVRRAVWSLKGALGKAYPTLSGPMRRFLSLHTTSAAPERNWSQWGNLYRKNRSSLGLERAEKLIAVSSAAKLRNKDKKPADEKELELLCHSVNEDEFGTALVDSVLVVDP